jgi:DNA-binding NarL/FixJ family response regulator
MSNKIRIFLADDHQVLIDGMFAILKTNPSIEVVGYSLNGDQLFEKVFEQKADILIMDINMPVKDGIEVLKEFTIRGYCCKVIVLSSYDDFKLIKEVLKLGASGYLSKHCAGESIIEAIMTVAVGNQYYSQNIRNKIFNSFVTNGANHTKNIASLLPLSYREVEILKLISQEYSSKEICEELFISINTVETHRKNLIKKLNVKNTIGLVKYALKHNLIT